MNLFLIFISSFNIYIFRKLKPVALLTTIYTLQQCPSLAYFETIKWFHMPLYILNWKEVKGLKIDKYGLINFLVFYF